MYPPAATIVATGGYIEYVKAGDEIFYWYGSHCWRKWLNQRVCAAED